MILKYKYPFITSIIIILAVIMTSYTGVFKNINDNIYDYYLQLNKSNVLNNQVVIVKIDEKTIKKLGSWPIDRHYYSDLLEIIFDNGAKVAGIYLEFSTPIDQAGNDLLLKSLREHPIVTLTPYTFNRSEPDNEYWNEIRANVNLSHDILNVDKNEFVRNFSPVLNQTPSFSLAVLNAYDKKAFNYNKPDNSICLKKQIYDNANRLKSPINYKTPFYQFKSYSLSDILDGNYQKDDFKDRIVLVGLTKERLIPFYKTPLSTKFSFSGKVPPIVIQAQIIDAFLNDRLVNIPDSIYLYIFIIVYIPLLIVILKQHNIVRQVVTLSILSIMEVLLSFIIFTTITYWISPLLFLCSNLYILIITTLITHFKVSNFLDRYIGELSNKKEVSSKDASVDNKLLTLKEITSLIEKDRDILDTILNSFKSIIVLFNENGEIIYTNSQNSILPLTMLLKEICFIELKTLLEEKEDKDYRKYFNFNNLEIEFIANKARDNLYTGVFNDITEISQINETKNTIARMLSHELKTPLTSILLSCDAVLGVNKKDRLENYIGRIIDQAEFIKEIIIDFLELNKIEMSEFQLNKSPFNICSLFDTIIKGFIDITESKNIVINTNLDLYPSLEISGDKKYLTIVFKNLIDNAIKYSSPGSEVVINCEELEDTIQISVIDQGFGIEDECLDALFKKFYRIKTSQTEEIQGTGLGLSFVKKIIELHQATINVKSEVNKGSTFIVSLPKGL